VGWGGVGGGGVQQAVKGGLCVVVKVAVGEEGEYVSRRWGGRGGEGMQSGRRQQTAACCRLCAGGIKTRAALRGDLVLTACFGNCMACSSAMYYYA
jgi:hypothetical protein